MNKRNKIFQIFIEILSECSLHGVKNILRNKHLPVKLLWAFSLTCSASYFFYSMTIPITNYLEYQVETNLKVKKRVDMIFPIVKICKSDLNVPGQGDSSFNDFITYKQVLTLYKNIYKSYDDPQRRKIGIANLSDIIISCIFNFKYCNTTEFSYVYDFNFGSCWQFNSDTGQASGLLLELYVGSAYENKNFLSDINGFELWISDENFEAYVKRGIPLITGKTTHVTLDKYTIDMAPKPYSNCVANLITKDSYPSETYAKTIQQAIKTRKLYHYDDCSYVCFQKLVSLKCNCYMQICDPYYPNMRICLQVTDIPCVQNIYAEFLANKKLLESCDCPRECSKTDYSTTISFADYPTQYYTNFLANKSLVIQNKYQNQTLITQSDLKQKILAVKIYFQNLNEIFVSQKPRITSFDLFAKIGTLMSIFLGLSMLSFVEIFEFLAKVIFILIKTKPKQKPKSRL